MKISILGYMGSGKSTIGKNLAQKLNLNFIDLDQYIEHENNETISGIFAQYGEIKFRKMERESLAGVLNSDFDLVIASGGGTPAYYDNMELINEKSISIYLRLSIKEIVNRLTSEKYKRPLIAHLNNEQLPEFIAKHLFERRNFYEQADLTIEVNNRSIEEIVTEIIQNLPHLK